MTLSHVDHPVDGALGNGLLCSPEPSPSGDLGVCSVNPVVRLFSDGAYDDDTAVDCAVSPVVRDG